MDWNISNSLNIPQFGSLKWRKNLPKGYIGEGCGHADTQRLTHSFQSHVLTPGRENEKKTQQCEFSSVWLQRGRPGLRVEGGEGPRGPSLRPLCIHAANLQLTKRQESSGTTCEAETREEGGSALRFQDREGVSRLEILRLLMSVDVG